MIWIVFIGGLVTGALLVALGLLLLEILEIGSDMDVIRQHAEHRYNLDRKTLERKAQAPWN